jgi:mRNA interferase YafQ
MLELHYTAKFRRDLKRIEKRRLDKELLKAVLETLQQEKPLDPKYKDHALKGNYADFRECHIRNDWLLIYAIDSNHITLTASRTGTHTDLLE